MSKLEERYLKEIEKPSLTEVVDEHFDSITTMLTPNAVLYGSTITSIIAGFPIEGDLDIAVSHLEFVGVAKNLANSAKWVQVEGSRIAEDDFSRSKPSVQVNAKPYTTTFSSKSRSTGSSRGGSLYSRLKSEGSVYPGAPGIPVSQVVAFKTVNGARVQIVESKGSEGDPLEDALAVVRKVDFVFCGIGMDKYGRLLEVIEGAYDDCCQKIIRIAQYDPLIKPNKLKQRFDKYTKRGWSLGISVDQAMIDLGEATKSYQLREAKRTKKLKAKQAKQKSRQSKAMGSLYEIRGQSIIFRPEFVKIVPVDIIGDTAKHVFGKAGHLMAVSDRSPEFVEIISGDKVSNWTLGALARKICQRINDKYRMDIAERISVNKKKKRTKTAGGVGYSMHEYGNQPSQYGGFASPSPSPAAEIATEIASSGTDPEEQIEPEASTWKLPEENGYNISFGDPPLLEEEGDNEVDEAIEEVPWGTANNAEGPGSDEAINHSSLLDEAIDHTTEEEEDDMKAIDHSLPGEEEEQL